MIEKNANRKILRSVALISLIFAGVVSILVILNFIQLNRVDPVNTELINQLVDRLNDEPGDQQLREQIRELDLLARKAYFSNRWQIRTGSYLILISLALFVIIYQLLDLNIKKQVVANPDAPRDALGIKRNARIGISVVGALLVITALILAFFMQKDKNYKQDLMLDAAKERDVLKEANKDKIIAVLDSTESNSPVAIETDSSHKSKEEAIDKQAGENKEIDKTPEENKEVIQKVKETKEFPSAAELKKNAANFRAYNGNGIVFQQGFPTSWNGQTGQNILWKSPVPINAYNSPIVWDDKIFLTGANNDVREVYCYDKNSGKLLWTTKIENVPGSPAAPPKTTADTGLGAPTMTTDGNLVYAIFGTGDLVGLDMDGKVIWAKNLGVPQNHYGHSSSLLMHREKLIVQYDQKSGGQLMAFKGSTGDILWSTSRKVKISWASPIIVNYNGQDQIIIAADPLVAAYNPYTGKELWQLDCIFGEVGPSACYDNGIVYAVNDYAKISAIDLSDPSKLLWENMDILSDIPSPIAYQGLLLMPTSYGLLGCFDGKTGDLYWEHEYDDNTFASPVIAGGLVYLMDTKGNTHIFKLGKEGYQSVSDCPLGEDSVCTPAFADGRIYIRTEKHLYCIGNN